MLLLHRRRGMLFLGRSLTKWLRILRESGSSERLRSTRTSIVGRSTILDLVWRVASEESSHVAAVGLLLDDGLTLLGYESAIWPVSILQLRENQLNNT